MLFNPNSESHFGPKFVCWGINPAIEVNKRNEQRSVNTNRLFISPSNSFAEGNRNNKLLVKTANMPKRVIISGKTLSSFTPPGAVTSSAKPEIQAREMLKP